MNNCAFTICATNYIGLAKILGNSIKKYYGDVDFYIFVADEPNMHVRKSFGNNILVAKDVLDYQEGKWYEMAFKYDITEFCTSIKPKTILYLFKQGYQKVVYFDPDILCFSSIGNIFAHLDNYSAIITPHITEIELNDSEHIFKERQLFYSGVYNLGFLAVRNNQRIINFLIWWSDRLKDCCFRSMQPFFTDQKWIDILPSYLGSDLLISINKGMNVAPWNFYERKIISNEGNTLKVTNRSNENDKKIDELIFVHYSGFDYSSLLSGKINRKDSKNDIRYKDLYILFDHYRQELKNGNFSEYIQEPYTYNWFINSNVPVNNFIRKLYFGYISVNQYPENPFDTKSKLFRKAIKLGIIKKNGGPKEVAYYKIKNKVSKEIRFLNMLFKFLFKIMGANRYFLFCKLMKKYSLIENNWFLLSNKKHFDFFEPKH
jgi:hypothetical protein